MDIRPLLPLSSRMQPPAYRPEVDAELRQLLNKNVLGLYGPEDEVLALSDMEKAKLVADWIQYSDSPGLNLLSKRLLYREESLSIPDKIVPGFVKLLFHAGAPLYLRPTTEKTQAWGTREMVREEVRLLEAKRQNIAEEEWNVLGAACARLPEVEREWIKTSLVNHLILPERLKAQLSPEALAVNEKRESGIRSVREWQREQVRLSPEELKQLGFDTTDFNEALARSIAAKDEQMYKPLVRAMADGDVRNVERPDFNAATLAYFIGNQAAQRQLEAAGQYNDFPERCVKLAQSVLNVRQRKAETTLQSQNEPQARTKRKAPSTLAFA